MTEGQASYRQIFKATSLFGGVQVFSILIGIVRTKFVAVLLGTTGVGIMGLLNSPLQLIISITGFGIAFSAVRDVSEAYGSNNETRIAAAIKTLRRWSWLTGLLGAVLTVSLAPLLSQWTFGNREYTWAFIWLSITLFVQALSKGQKAILQGTRKLKDMAKAGVIGSALGLFTSIPLYYFYGIKGIVPAMIITAFTGLFLSWYYSRRVRLEPIYISFRELYRGGVKMAKLGIFITLAGFLSTASTYILNAFIRDKGGIDQVGLYNAGWGVVAQYTGLIFTAMATDYYPRLSAVNNDIEKIKVLVRQQAETALFIMTPLLALMIITMPLVVRLFYTASFLPIVLFANLTVLGMPLKAISWSMGYILLAKGEGRLFFGYEFLAGLVILALNLLGYSLFGLEGLGISFIVSFIFSIAIIYFTIKKKYNFSLPISFWRMAIIIYFFTAAAFSSSLVSNIHLKYISGIVIFIASVAFSLYNLNKVMDLISLLSELKGRFTRSKRKM